MSLSSSRLGSEFAPYDVDFMYNVVKTCCEQGIRTFYDEKMPDGSVIHSFARRLDINPVTGIVAVAIAVLSIREPNERLLKEQILKVIEQLGEHIPGGFFIYKTDEEWQLLYANKAVFGIYGCESLEDFKAMTGFTFRGMVHPEDFERISASIRGQMNKSQSDLECVEYRIIRKDGATRWIEDYGHYVDYDEHNGLCYVFISDITDKYEQEESAKALYSAVIEALTRPYDSVCLIDDMETQSFHLYRVSDKMAQFMSSRELTTFTEAAILYSKLLVEEDREKFLDAVTPEKIITNTRNKSVYSVSFRRIFEDGIRNYRVEFARLDLGKGAIKVVVGFKDVDGEN